MQTLQKFFTATAIIMLIGGCQNTYYNTMEKFGVHKRDILVDRVEEARDSQEDAKAQFTSALAQFSAVTNFQGGELEDYYNKLNAEFEASEEAAEEVHKRIKAVEKVSEALFEEWQEELSLYSSDKLKRSSQRQLSETKQKYGQLIGTMKRVEKKIEPVLAVFRDQTLFLKHNLNARAVSSLKSELKDIQTDVASLVKAMEKSIGEANNFIQTLHQ